MNQSKHVGCKWCNRRMYAGGPCFVNQKKSFRRPFPSESKDAFRRSLSSELKEASMKPLTSESMDINRRSFPFELKEAVSKGNKCPVKACIKIGVALVNRKQVVSKGDFTQLELA